MESFVLKNSFINKGNKNMSFMMPVEDTTGEKVLDHAKEIFVELFQEIFENNDQQLLFITSHGQGKINVKTENSFTQQIVGSKVTQKSYITSEQIQQAIFEYDGQKDMIQHIISSRNLKEDLYIEKEQLENLIDIFVESSDLNLDQQQMEEGPLTLESLIYNEKVQKTVSDNIFTEEQLVAAMKELISKIYTKMFITMPVDSQIDAIFQRAQFNNELNFNNIKESQESSGYSDSNVDQSPLILEYDDDEEFDEAFKQKTSEQQQTEQTASNEAQDKPMSQQSPVLVLSQQTSSQQEEPVDESQDPAEQMFFAIFGTNYSSIDPEKVFTIQEVLSQNVESESSEMIEHIFEQFDNPEKLKASQIYKFLLDNLAADAQANQSEEIKGISPRVDAPIVKIEEPKKRSKVIIDESQFMKLRVNIQGEPITYDELKEQGLLPKYIDINFNLARNQDNDIREMEELLVKMQSLSQPEHSSEKTISQTDHILLQFMHYFTSLNDQIYNSNQELLTNKGQLNKQNDLYLSALQQKNIDKETISNLKLELTEKETITAELRAQIDTQINKLDVNEQRVAGESKSLEEQVKKLTADNKFYQSENQKLDKVVKKQQQEMGTNDVTLRKEVIALRAENVILQDKSQELMKQLESTESEYLWQIKLSERAAEKIQLFREEKDQLTVKNVEYKKEIRNLRENNKNLETIFQEMQEKNTSDGTGMESYDYSSQNQEQFEELYDTNQQSEGEYNDELKDLEINDEYQQADFTGAPPEVMQDLASSYHSKSNESQELNPGDSLAGEMEEADQIQIVEEPKLEVIEPKEPKRELSPLKEPFVPKEVSPVYKDDKQEQVSAKKAIASLEDDGFVVSRFSATPTPEKQIPAKQEIKKAAPEKNEQKKVDQQEQKNKSDKAVKEEEKLQTPQRNRNQQNAGESQENNQKNLNQQNESPAQEPTSSVKRKTQDSKKKQSEMKKITDKNQIYNLLQDKNLPRNQTFVHKPEFMTSLYTNVNKVLRDRLISSNSKRNQIKKQKGGYKIAAQRITFSLSDQIRPDMPPLDLFMEKVHILENGTLSEVLMFVHKNLLNFVYLEKPVSFVKPIDILEDLKSVWWCTMIKRKKRDLKNPDQIPQNLRHNLDYLLEDGKKPVCQYIGIQLKEESLSGDKPSSHIYIVQHQFNSNFVRLQDFINYQRIKNDIQELPIEERALNEFFSVVNEGEQGSFKFQKIKFEIDMIGNGLSFSNTDQRLKDFTQIKYDSMSDLFVIQKKGYFQMISQWINCVLELKIPKLKIQETIHVFHLMSDKEKYETVESILIDLHGEEFRSKNGYNTDSEAFAKDFHMIVQIKVGANDINNDKVTAALILNNTMAVIDISHYEQQSRQQFNAFTLSLDQYFKRSSGGPSMKFEIEGFSEFQQTSKISYSFAQMQQQNSIQTFKKWTTVLYDLSDQNIFNSGGPQYLLNQKEIQRTITKVFHRDTKGL